MLRKKRLEPTYVPLWQTALILLRRVLIKDVYEALHLIMLTHSFQAFIIYQEAIYEVSFLKT